ncbi:hypothetical protein BHE74_00044130 [Ensete ventricosum]|nr:hypothetical protein BHE74_00044130 [Ensete ventricosum]
MIRTLPSWGEFSMEVHRVTDLGLPKDKVPCADWSGSDPMIIESGDYPLVISFDSTGSRFVRMESRILLVL